jgi:hypothetical protein
MAPRTLRNPWGMPTAGSVAPSAMPIRNSTRTIYTAAARAAMNRRRAQQQILMRHHPRG